MLLVDVQPLYRSYGEIDKKETLLKRRWNDTKVMLGNHRKNLFLSIFTHNAHLTYTMQDTVDSSIASDRNLLF